MKALANLLRRLADRLDPHEETVEISDEYDICRCRIEVHSVDATYVELPTGWAMHILGNDDFIDTAGH